MTKTSPLRVGPTGEPVGPTSFAEWRPVPDSARYRTSTKSLSEVLALVVVVPAKLHRQ